MATATVSNSLLDSTRSSAVEYRHSAAPAKSYPDDALTRAQSGDPDGFSELYRQHKKRVFSVCLRMVHDFQIAEDLTQETFLQLHRKLATFRGDSAFTTWLHRMTVNIVLMRLRKHVLPVVSLDRLVTSGDEEHAGQGFGICDTRQAGVVDRLAIDRAVAALAPGYRTVFLLHDVHGLQHSEIAAIEGCSLGNSKSQLHKARRALRGVLATRANSGAGGLAEAAFVAGDAGLG
jgi:RNA polymerase sigma-70 factor, ECF subfamily